MATRLLLITVQIIACSQLNISSGVTAKGKQEQIVTQGMLPGCVDVRNAYHRLTNAFTTVENYREIFKACKFKGGCSHYYLPANGGYQCYPVEGRQPI